MFTLRKKVIVTICLVTAMIIGASLSLQGVMAEEAKSGEKVEYKLKWTLEENLAMFKGKYVRITLSSGQTMSGTLKDVNTGLLHLEKIAGRDYFDALIRVKDISAFDAKFRGF